MKKLKLYYFLMPIAIILLLIVNNNNKIDKVDIDKLLLSKEYAYLPTEAKEYIKDVYKTSGEVILTEKNKKYNTPYLNPQYVEYLTYSDEQKSAEEVIPTIFTVDYSNIKTQNSYNLPSSYDLRDVDGNNYMTPVRDQGNLGLCWTFATAGALESYLLKTTNTSYTSESQLISERQIDYLTSTNGINDYKSEYTSFISRKLGDGGNFYVSTVAMANGVSSFDYNSFKAYDDSDLSKMELSDVINYSKSLYEINSTINFPNLGLRESTEELTDKEKNIRTNFLNEVKSSIMKNGAAYVSTYMNSTCKYVDPNLNETVIDVYNCSETGGHAMGIIGWNDDLEYSYCADTTTHNSDISSCKRIVKGKGVWILKNSWGDSTQHPYLTYDSLYSNISFIDGVSSKDEKNWDNNYILGSQIENTQSSMYYISNTKIKNQEILKKIKFITSSSNSSFDIKISTSTGDYTTIKANSDLPGLITVEIPDIVIDKNTRVVIEGKDSYYIDKVSFFTSNIDNEPYINLDEYNNESISDTQFRLYSETKNIDSGSVLAYKVYDSENQDVSNNFEFLNTVVAENNVNTLVNISNTLETGDYRIDVIYNSNVISQTNIKYTRMEGSGTKEDPYIITNSTQLNQIRNDLDGYYELANDIDLSQVTSPGGKLSLSSDLCPQGFGWEAINGFSGTLDGKGHTIKGLYQNNYLTCEFGTEYNNKGNGLFGNIIGNVTIKNIILDGFNMNCQNGYCGIVASQYYAYMKEDGSIDYYDENEYTATFENIAVTNSKINGSGNPAYGGGLFGSLNSYGNINISNIYLNMKSNLSKLFDKSFLASEINGNNVLIQNIQLAGDMTGNYSDGSGDAVLIYKMESSGLTSIKNILSTVTAKNVTSNLIGNTITSGGTGKIEVDGVNIININNKPICNGVGCSSVTNVNIYDYNTQLNEFTKKENYETWENFDDNWVIKTIDGIPRIPMLKFLNYDYTKMTDITIKHELNKKVNLYEYISPDAEFAKRINYKSNDESIIKIDSDGVLIPQSTGKTTIHVESLYDGYINDIPIVVEYKPHYTIHFDSNPNDNKEIKGSMNSIEVEAGQSFTLPANQFTQQYSEFKEWNTKADGSGTSYLDLSEIPAMNDKDEITLYVQWWGKERIVTFDANGGTVDPDKKVVRYYSEYGELPIPIRPGYGFKMWLIKGGNVYADAFVSHFAKEFIASWVENAYTIKYDANGGVIKDEYKKDQTYKISDSVATSYAENGKDATINKNIYEKAGYKFKEWNTKADGTGNSYKELEKINFDNVENSMFSLYAIWEEDFDYVINNYDVDEIDKHIDFIDINTTVSDFKNNINLNSGYTIEVDYKTVNGKDLLYTGGKTKIYKNNELYSEYQNIIRGDVNGNAVIDIIDYIRIMKDIMGSSKLTGVYYKAADVNKNGIIDIIDYIRIMKMIMEGN